MSIRLIRFAVHSTVVIASYQCHVEALCCGIFDHIFSKQSMVIHVHVFVISKQTLNRHAPMYTL